MDKYKRNQREKRRTKAKKNTHTKYENKQKINKTCHFATEHAFNAKKIAIRTHTKRFGVRSDFRENGIRSAKHSIKIHRAPNFAWVRILIYVYK